MKIEIDRLIGVQTVTAPSIHAWRKEPGDGFKAIRAAAQLAKSRGFNMVVVLGNSYMQTVYHIGKETDDLRTYTFDPNPTVYLVTPEGQVFLARASK